jgi:hypothetical protein
MVGGTSGSYASRSPIKLGSSKPHWALAADALVRVAGMWGRPDSTFPPAVFGNLPPHRKSKGNSPAGGNEVFADGSAQWVKFELMYAFHTWRTDRICLWYQDTKDIDPKWTQNALKSVAASNFK